MTNPTSSFKDLGNIIETDQAIAARVLKLANSAFYGLRGMVSSIHQATVILGHETLGELITVAGSSKLLGSVLKGYGLDSGFLWQHSLAVAFGSKIIAHKINPKIENDAFSAGLLHDSGKLALDKFVYEKEQEFETFMDENEETFLGAEKKIFGFDHAEIAFELCTRWGIPEVHGRAIRFHHYPSRSKNNELSYIIHAADILSMRGGIGTGVDSMLYKMEEGTLEFLGLKEEKTNDIMNEIVDSVDKIAQQIHDV